MFDNPPEPDAPGAPVLDKRLAHNLLAILQPQVQQAQALLEAAQVLGQIAMGAPAPVPPPRIPPAVHQPDG